MTESIETLREQLTCMLDSDPGELGYGYTIQHMAQLSMDLNLAVLDGIMDKTLSNSEARELQKLLSEFHKLMKRASDHKQKAMESGLAAYRSERICQPRIK